MRDVAMALDALVPGAAYSGSLTANDRAAFDALDWQDQRAKPAWAAVQAAMADPAALIADVRAAVAAHVEAQARAWGYDSAVSLASYTASTNAAWAAEAVAFVAWRDAIWGQVLADLAALQAGQGAPVATVADYLAGLPVLVRPAA